MRVRSERRVYAVGLLISAVVHAVLLGLRIDGPPVFVDAWPSDRDPRDGVSAMRAYAIVEVDGEAGPPDVEVVERPEARDRPDRERTAFDSGDPPPEAPAGALSPDRAALVPLSERLAPSGGDPRLWAPTRRVPLPADPTEQVHARIRERLAPFNDSIAAEAAAEASANDWTRTDGGGRRWGLAPGQIHVGGITISTCKAVVGALDPFTCQFRVTPGRRDEHAERMREFDEIRAQALRIEALENLEHRARAIRARANAARDSARTRPPQ